MKEVVVGTRFKINKTIVTILKIQDGLALVEYPGGGKFCYGINGIRQSQILD